MVWSKKVNHRKVGDRHRDARDWDQAVAAYRRHLNDNPDDGAIWTQFGHALKESGQLNEAEVAYRTATELRPANADAHLQLAHALKLQGNLVEALTEYKLAADLDSEMPIEDEIRRLRMTVRHEPTVQLEPGATIYSLQDMFVYLQHHTTVTGIQRVLAGIALNIIESGDADAHFVLTDDIGGIAEGDFWLLDNEDVLEVIRYATGDFVDHARLIKLMRTVEGRARPIRVGEGHTIVMMGAFWGLGNTIGKFLPAKRRGARLGAYIYDIIPISHPEYCDVDLIRYFSMAFSEISLVIDFALTISDFTRLTVEKYLADNGCRQIPMWTVPLAHSLTGPPSTLQSWPKALQRIEGRDYVAYVSTIEGRKNHLYVVEAWKRLIAEGVEVPDLVFVGRKGWRNSALFDLLDSTRNLNGRVHIVHDLSDAELNAVYENCLFTVFTSFVEGWGLPVGESLLHGKPCVVSNTASLPEVGGDFVEYIDPINLAGGIEVFRKMITDRDYVAERARNIRENFVRRDWDDVAEDFVAKVDAQRDVPARPASAPLIAQGRLVKPSDLFDTTVTIPDYPCGPTGLLLVEGFYTAEAEGAWMKGSFQTLTFDTELAPGVAIVAYVKLYPAPWYREGSVTVDLGGDDKEPPRRFKIEQLRNSRPFLVKGHVGDDGLGRLTIEFEGSYTADPHETRDFVIGLAAFGYAAADNAGARIDLHEAFYYSLGEVA